MTERFPDLHTNVLILREELISLMTERFTGVKADPMNHISVMTKSVADSNTDLLTES